MITLATLAEATEQQVFDQVAEHLMKQGCRSYINDDVGCAYRGPTEGLMCAAGCLISDSEYRQTWEGKNWQGLVENHRVPATHMEMINELQDAHDGNLEPAGYQWRERIQSSLMYIAADRKLSTAALYAAFDAYKDAPTT